jgi:type III secretion protein J
MPKSTATTMARAALAALAFSLASCGGASVELVTGMPESEANAIVALLGANGIVATKSVAKDGSIALHVASANEADALAKLQEGGLPRRRYENLGQVFKKGGMVSSPLEEQARYVYALAQQLEDTLSNIDGVQYVRVHPVLPKKASMTGPGISASAGVFIKYRPGAEVADMVPEIRELVSRSIPDLEPSRVSVVAVVAPVSALVSEPDMRGDDGTTSGFNVWPWFGGVLFVLLASAAAAIAGMRRRRSKHRPAAGSETSGGAHES